MLNMRWVINFLEIPRYAKNFYEILQFGDLSIWKIFCISLKSNFELETKIDDLNFLLKI